MIPKLLDDTCHLCTGFAADDSLLKGTLRRSVRTVVVYVAKMKKTRADGRRRRKLESNWTRRTNIWFYRMCHRRFRLRAPDLRRFLIPAPVAQQKTTYVHVLLKCFLLRS
jgi:hypothetical protein